MTHEVIDNAEKFFKMPRAKIVGPIRERKYVIVRQMITAILREEHGLQWARIGGLIKRHHATIIHLHNNHKNDMVQSFTYAANFAEFRESCGFIENILRAEAMEILLNLESAKTIKERIEVISNTIINIKEDGRSKVV